MKSSKKVKPVKAIEQLFKQLSNVEIKVTQDDIDVAEQGSSMYCPIAYAAKRVFNTDEVDVASTLDVSTDELSESLVYELPQKATRFIEDFDDGKTVKPFTFIARLG